ncbi:prevent-host-death family protein [Micrococcales bacterium KH10]|nr:prevent-host-death family protein [Micrococcales bacterium KH10]
MSALRAELKSWIDRAKAGETVIITDRGVPVARLSGVESADLLTELVRDGLVTEPEKSREPVTPGTDIDSSADQRGGGIFSRRRR